jgi:multiple sugar transport system permease protein
LQVRPPIRAGHSIAVNGARALSNPPETARWPSRGPNAASRYRLGLYAMLAPYLTGTVVLVAIPIALSGILAFTAYDGLSRPEWHGVQNFREILGDPRFAIAVRNSLVFVALSIPLRLVITLTLALLLCRPRPGVGLYRVAVYLPTVVPGPAYALVWLWILNPLYGPLNLLLAALGLPAPAWLADSSTALPAIALTTLFQIGEAFVILLAGLQEIPDDYYHAAAIDGAGLFQQLRHLTLPLLTPWLLLVTLRDIIASAQNTFTPALLMTGGGPYYATLVLPLLIYETAFDRFRFGEGAAMTLVLCLGVGAIILLIYRAFGGWGYEDEA